MRKNLIERSIQLPAAVHQSDLNSFYGCPAKWALVKDRAYLSAADFSHMNLGSFFHDAIRQYFSALTQKPANETILRNMLSTFFESRWITRRIESLEKKYQTCIKTFIDFEVYRYKTWEEYLPTTYEERFTYSIGEYKYSGTIDFYSEPQSVMLDWKTSSSQELHVSHMRQSEVYRRAKPGVKTVMFICLASGKILTAPAMPNKWLLEQTKEFIETVKSGKYKKVYSQWCTNCEGAWACDFDGTRLWSREPWL